MTRSALFLLALLAAEAGALCAQGVGRPTGWRYPQGELKGGSFYQYPSPEKTKGKFELITRWSVPADAAFTGDVTGDGKLELVAQAGGVVSVYSGKGVLISSASVPGEVRLGALQDADGDKIDDLLLAGRVRDGLQVLFLNGMGGKIRQFDLKANTITPLDTKQANAFGAAIYGLRDLDGDGREEAVIALITGFDLNPRGILALDAATGAKKWYYPVGPGITQVLMQDINRDASPDVLAMAYSLGNKNVAPDGSHDFASFLYSLGGTGRLNWTSGMPVYHSGARIAAQDIDRDNTEEVVVSGYTAWQYLDKDMGLLAVLNGITGKTEKIVEGGKSFDDKGLVVTNSVGTGLAEIALGGREGMVRKYDHNLNPLASYTSTGAVSVMAGNDFIRTGRPDFFALTDENKLLLLDNGLKLLSSFEYPSGGREAAVLISDLIPGGSNEVVLLADKVYVLSALTNPRPEDQVGVSYKVLEDLPAAQMDYLKKKGAISAQLALHNKTGQEATLRITHRLLPGGEEAEERVDLSPAGDVELELFPEIPEKLAKKKKVTAARYQVIVERLLADGKAQKVFARKIKLRIHPKNRFFPAIKDATGRNIDLLASLVNWVDHQSEAADKIVNQASQLGQLLDPKVKITGPQSPGVFRGPKDNRTLEKKDRDYLAQVKLAYEAMQKTYGLTYKSAPVVLYYSAGVSQIVQSPDETARSNGNCIDNSVLFASVLERMEFRPLLALLIDEGHVLVGWQVEGPSAAGSPAHKYHFLDPNQFSPELPFEKALAAGRTWADTPALKPVLSGPVPFKDGLFGTADGSVILLDAAAIKEQPAD